MRKKLTTRARQAVLVLDIASAMPDSLFRGDDVDSEVDLLDITAELKFCDRVSMLANETFHTIPMWNKPPHPASPIWISWREQYALAAELLLEGWCPDNPIPDVSLDARGYRVLDR